VTGTDTDVGKTHVTAALVAALRAAGRPARAVKPIETGWNSETSDAQRLARASEQSIEQTIHLRFALPRSPAAAAEAEHRPIDFSALLEWCRQQAGDPLLIEGAGGWLVPIHGRHRMRELSQALGAKVLVVGRAGLGTINHCLLTIESAAPVGVILSRRPQDELEFARENAHAIEEHSGARVAIYPDQLPAILAWF